MSITLTGVVHACSGEGSALQCIHCKCGHYNNGHLHSHVVGDAHA